MTIIKSVSGRAVSVPGADLDTDRIIPARFLKEISFENMGKYLFYDVRFDADQTPKKHVLNDMKYLGASIMIVGRNFGCGSSREHAPQAINRFGINALIGESFAEIFAGNCKAIGVPLFTTCKENLDEIAAIIEQDPSSELTLDIEKKQLTINQKVIDLAIADSHRESFLKGYWNVLSLLKDNASKVNETASNLPYISGF
jgi:3-isopropylmalate/(R)-2-methylmalate dehydratase small subunit